jgi:hypothetical protein
MNLGRLTIMRHAFRESDFVVDHAFRKFGHCGLADMVSERWLSWSG